MTLKERVIVETYTGFCMTSGEERAEVYKYAAELMCRPVFTHELADVAIVQRLKELSKEEFVNLCRVQTNADKIRAMDDGELSKLIGSLAENAIGCKVCPVYAEKKEKGEHCTTCIKEVGKWLKRLV